MSKADDVFARQFAAILACLVVFMFLAIFLARSIGAVATEAQYQSEKEALARIAPVGQVRLDGEATPAAPAAAEPAATTAEAGAGSADGAGVYASACMACHAAGVAGAPKVGDGPAWEPRIAQGLDALVGSAINGKGAMPPRGGNASLSDDAIRAAVEHMLVETGVSAN